MSKPTQETMPLTESELAQVQLSLEGKETVSDEALLGYLTRMVNSYGTVEDSEVTALKDEIASLNDALAEAIGQAEDAEAKAEEAVTRADVAEEKLITARGVFDDIRTALARQP